MEVQNEDSFSGIGDTRCHVDWVVFYFLCVDTGLRCSTLEAIDGAAQQRRFVALHAR